jgi:hypothetical protein
VKQRAVVLAAIETVAKADPIRLSSGHDADIAAQAPARESLHVLLL